MCIIVDRWQLLAALLLCLATDDMNTWVSCGLQQLKDNPRRRRLNSYLMLLQYHASVQLRCEGGSINLTPRIWKNREVPARLTFCSSLFILPICKMDAVSRELRMVG